MGNAQTERAVAFIPVRLSSSRLPEKHFRRIGDRTVLEWVIVRLRTCRELDGIVVAVPEEPCNEPLREFCGRVGVDLFWFRGDVDHVTLRLRRAAEDSGAGICVLASGDCPLLDGTVIDAMIRKLRSSDADWLRQLAPGPGLYPALEGVVMARLSAWQRADDLADRPEFREHQFPLLSLRPDVFRFADFRVPPELCLPGYHRTSIDTPADLEFLNAVWAELDRSGEPFDLASVVRLLHQRPELKEINAHVHQRSLREVPARFMVVLDAGGEFGLGHLLRGRELASQLTERLGWSGRFVVDDESAREALRGSGFRVEWGAFGRPPREAEKVTVEFRHPPEKCDLLIVDVFDQRGPSPGWRDGWPSTPRVLSVENACPWAAEADAVLFPSPLRTEAEIRRRLGSRVRGGRPVIWTGEEFCLLRRQVRELRQRRPERDLDLLVYLHRREQREVVLRLLERSLWRVRILEEPTPEFARMLARTRCFLSGFGVAFWESLALAVRPICWPDSEAHRSDAKRFYQWVGIDPPWILKSANDLPPMLESALEGGPLRSLEDGGPRLTSALADLMRCT